MLHAVEDENAIGLHRWKAALEGHLNVLMGMLPEWRKHGAALGAWLAAVPGSQERIPEQQAPPLMTMNRAPT